MILYTHCSYHIWVSVSHRRNATYYLAQLPEDIKVQLRLHYSPPPTHIRLHHIKMLVSSRMYSDIYLIMATCYTYNAFMP